MIVQPIAVMNCPILGSIKYSESESEYTYIVFFAWGVALTRAIKRESLDNSQLAIGLYIRVNRVGLTLFFLRLWFRSTP